MTLATFELAAAGPAALVAALQCDGAVSLRDPRLPDERCDRALADVAALFAAPREQKQRIAITRSPHHRGYSEMHNERDWREQVHFGRELPAAAGGEPFWRLQGPNLWPADAGFRARMLEYMAAVEAIGAQFVRTVAGAFGLAAEPWLGESPYVLMKGIGYHAQPVATERRRGVAAHLDFSLVTLTLQDEVGGLEVQRPGGEWIAVPPRRGTFLVNVGELLAFVTGGRLAATPHRVVNPSAARSRISIPVFVNPSLSCRLERGLPPVAPARSGAEHVHAVLDDDSPSTLHFGTEEWRRKGENRWCAVCAGTGRAPQGPGGQDSPDSGHAGPGVRMTRA